jgi:hypothetical protein
MAAPRAYTTPASPARAATEAKQATVPLKIRVVEGPDAGHSHALYEIQLSLPHGQAWAVQRRYSEFEALKNELEPFITDAERAAFPLKHVLSSSKAADVVQERLRELPRW